MSVISILSSISNLWNSLYGFLFYSWPFILLVVGLILRRKWRKYPLEAVILEKRGDNLVKTNDRIGKFYDKHGEMHTYRFAKTKDTIPVYNFDWILHNAIVHTSFIERIINLLRPTIGTVFLFRYGSKQYKPINIKQNPSKKVQLKELKGKKGETLFSYQYAQFDPRWVVGALDFEVIDWDNMNFMVQEQRASIVRRQKKGEFWKQTLIPIVIIVACLLIGIFILKFSADAGVSLRGGGGGGGDGGGGSKIAGALSNVFTPGQ